MASHDVLIKVAVYCYVHVIMCMLNDMHLLMNYVHL